MFESDLVFCEPMGGWIDRNTIIPREHVQVGDRVCIAPLDTITRELWGVVGTVAQAQERTTFENLGRFRNRVATHYFVQFDEPTKSVGARMTGIWLRKEALL